MAQQVLFVTGVGRSGTTVLQSMLHSHSAINFNAETHFFKRYLLPYLLKGRVPSKEVLAADPYLSRLDKSRHTALLKLPLNTQDSLKEGFELIMGSGENTAFIGDKDTEYVRYFPHLKKLYPDAWMIHIIRDPRDVVASRMKTECGAKRSIEFHIAEYRYYIQKVRKEGPALFGNHFLELKYEDLIVNPEEELTKLLNPLGLTYEPGMLEFYKSGNQLVADDEMKWKENVAKPLNAGNFGKWKASLTEHDAALLQVKLEKFFEEMNYEMVGASVPIARSLKVATLRQLFVGKTMKEKLS